MESRHMSIAMRNLLHVLHVASQLQERRPALSSIGGLCRSHSRSRCRHRRRVPKVHLSIIFALLFFLFFESLPSLIIHPSSFYHRCLWAYAQVGVALVSVVLVLVVLSKVILFYYCCYCLFVFFSLSHFLLSSCTPLCSLIVA